MKRFPKSRLWVKRFSIHSTLESIMMLFSLFQLINTNISFAVDFCCYSREWLKRSTRELVLRYIKEFPIIHFKRHKEWREENVTWKKSIQESPRAVLMKRCQGCRIWERFIYILEVKELSCGWVFQVIEFKVSKSKPLPAEANHKTDTNNLLLFCFFFISFSFFFYYPPFCCYFSFFSIFKYLKQHLTEKKMINIFTNLFLSLTTFFFLDVAKVSSKFCSYFAAFIFVVVVVCF